MATFLELCKATAQECGIGNADGSEPSTVVNQSGELKRIVDWVRQSYTDLQNRHENWLWLRVGFTLITVPGVSVYPPSAALDDLTLLPITRFGRWLVDDCYDYPKIYLQASGLGTQTWLSFLPWNSYKSVFRIGINNTTLGAPGHITIDPQNNLVFGPIPNGIYLLSGDYVRSPQILMLNGDVPEMPARFHDLIMYGAMEKYALYESATEVLARARAGRRDLLGRLEADQLPDMEMAGPLA